MKVPLMMTARKKSLIITNNSKTNIVGIPFQPFVLCEAKQFQDIRKEEDVLEQWIKLPDHKKVEYFRAKFESIDDQRDFVTRNKDKERFIYSNSYHEQLYISNPDFVLDHANTNDLKIMFWDIETKTIGDGKFSKSYNMPILCIGYSIWKYKNDGTSEKIKQCIIDTYNDETLDTEILKEFTQTIKDEDVDIIAGYNSEKFDFPYYYDRSKLMKVPIDIGRNGKEPFITETGKIYINGRIHYDMYKKVIKDQSLFGLKKRNLKVVARHYDVPLTKELDIELKEEIQNTWKVYHDDHKKLVDYQDADVVRTEHVGLIYIRNDVTLAERMQVPLDSTMNSYSSFIPKLFIARNQWKRQQISTETNFSKYNSITGSYAKFPKYDNKELKYQGALVGLYKHGYFPMTKKLDFTSMYPSAACTFNLGPDTTKLIRVEEYTGKYSFRRDNKYNWYRIPDQNFNRDLIVRVRNDIEGYLKQDIKMLWDERAKIKAEMKTAKANGETDKLKALDSQQLAIKVILNSIYGIQGLRSSVYGDMITGAMITAMCRYTTGRTIQKYEHCLVELDTDGLAIDAAVSEEETNKWLDDIIYEKFGIDENYMQMELDEVGPAYFCAMKNYVTLDNGHIHLHGSSLKSSGFCRLQDRARDLAIEHIFNQKPIEEVVREAYDFDSCSLDDFEFRVKLSKDKKSYSDLTGQILFLAKQMEVSTETDCGEGTLIPYVITNKQLTDKVYKDFYKSRKTKGKNYTYVGLVDDTKDIDISYYEKQIDSMLKLFDIQRVEQTDLFASAGMQVGDKKVLEKVNHDLEHDPEYKAINLRK